MKDPDGRVMRGKLVGKLAGAVGGRVVDDQEPVVRSDRRERSPHSGDDRLEVLALVVGGQDDPHRARRPVSRHRGSIATL
jgi:hypothetical protein